MAVVVLTESELRQCVCMNQDALQTVENAFTWLAQGRVEMPPIMHIEVADRNGDIDIKSAYVRGLDYFAVKLASGYFDNPKLGLPSSSAMVVVFDAKTGFCSSVMLDNGYLTDLRTGLAGAVAARHLAPDSVETVGIVGSGVQARYQLQSLALVRQFNRVLVHARDQQKLQQYCDEMGKAFELSVEAADLERLSQESQVIITTTPATQPLIQAEWLQPGSHITAMGSDLSGKQELDPAVLSRADLLVCDNIAQCERMGELQHAVGKTIQNLDQIVELGEITSGEKPGRTSQTQITVCDLTGTGVQDTAIALTAINQARKQDLGTSITS